MNYYSINILKCDVTFVTDAIRIRGNAIADAIMNQVFEIEKKQLMAKIEEESSWESKDVNDQIVMTQTFDKKVTKSNVAPYGYRLDGKPKKRPGRPLKKGRK